MAEDDIMSLRASIQYLKRKNRDLESQLASRNPICMKCLSLVKKHVRINEDRIFDVFMDRGLLFSRNRKCSRYTPDFVFDGGTHFVVVEVDEHQHKKYTENRDARMLSVQHALALPTTFVRFNPDEYKPGDDSREAHNEEREKLLVQWVKKLLNQEMQRVSDAQVIYLFFDGFVNGHEAISKVDHCDHDQDIDIGKLLAGAQAIAHPNGSSDARWQTYARCYMAGWGLDRLDEKFVRDHGVRPSCPKVAQLIRVLYPVLCAEATLETSVSGRVFALRTPLIREVIAALGFASPFDTSHRIPDLMAVWEEKLKHTEYFAKYKESCRLFGIPGRTSAWNKNSISKALGTVFGSIGMHLDSSRTQHRVDGKKVNTFAYAIEPVKRSEMLELVRIKMKLSEFRSASPNKQARDLLLADEYPKYGHLVDLEKRRLLDSFAFIE